MTAQTITLNLPDEIYQRAKQTADELKRPLDDVLVELLQIQLQPTEHPYIVRREGFRGGRPIVRGSSVPVWRIAGLWKSGDTIEDISRAYSHLELAAIYDAISYYLDHRDEIESQIAENRLERVLQETNTTMTADGVLKPSDG
jgi:uncharacterized protein (DUF433 family)